MELILLFIIFICFSIFWKILEQIDIRVEYLEERADWLEKRVEKLEEKGGTE